MDTFLFSLLILLLLRVISVDDLEGIFATFTILLAVLWLWSVCWPLVVLIGVLGVAAAGYFYSRY